MVPTVGIYIISLWLRQLGRGMLVYPKIDCSSERTIAAVGIFAILLWPSQFGRAMLVYMKLSSEDEEPADRIFITV